MTPDQLEDAWAAGRIVPLAAPQDQTELAGAWGKEGPGPVLEGLQRCFGPGVVVGSGGSSGRRRWCLQPLRHLQASADATGAWLQQQGLDPAACLHLNPLPMHHVSGLLPLVRARRWGCDQRSIAPDLMRDPEALVAALLLPADRPLLLSLVPTQLQRLMASDQGLAWLRRLAVIWVGGAPLLEAEAARARAEGLRLAPCYGATETAGMVCVLAPERFLAGAGGCGHPLGDGGLRIEVSSGAIAVRCARLSPGFLAQGELYPLPASGDIEPLGGSWWESGDAGRLGPEGLRVLGRLDGAIHSGGETLFPEVLEERLQAEAKAAGLPLRAVLLLSQVDPEWGQRLVALVRAVDGVPLALEELQALTWRWKPAERPRRWHWCPRLAPTANGKWQRSYWQQWLISLQADTSRPHHDLPHRH